MQLNVMISPPPRHVTLLWFLSALLGVSAIRPGGHDNQVYRLVID